MPKVRSLYPMIRLAITCLILTVGLRTWLVMGLIEPVTVSGSSMVPLLRGSYVTPQCSDCGQAFEVGAEFAAVTREVSCPQCAQTRVPLESLTVQRGDRLWVDRVSLQWHKPERWETVVARNPDDATRLCIKRVVGLPGEQVSLRDGNVRVDGAIVTKSPRQQLQMRRLVHREHTGAKRWSPDDASHWRFRDTFWQHVTPTDSLLSWLRYEHPAGQAVTDNNVYNAGITRRLNLIDEFMLSTKLQVRGEGSVHLTLNSGSASAEVSLHFPGGKLKLTESGRRSAELQLSDQSLQRLTSGQVQLDVGNFDRQLLLVIDDHIELRRSWPKSKALGTSRPVAIGVQGLTAWLGGLSLFRDTYHSDGPVGTASPSTAHWQLGADEYFLLGDNAPVSLDSRLWGPVPARLLIGRPLLSGR